MRILLLLAACQSAPLPATPSGPELTFSNMSIVQYSQGAIVYRAQATHATGDRNKLALENVNVTHRGIAETGSVKVTARRAVVEPATGALQIDGNVRVQDSFGRKLTTDKIDYAMGPSGHLLLHVPGPVHIESKEGRFDATGMEGDPDTGVVQVRGPVSGDYVP